MSQHTVVMGPTRVLMEEFEYESDPEMARYEIDTNMKWADLKYVFGWDNMLQTFFLQVHDAFVLNQDINPVRWLGALPNTYMTEVSQLSAEALHLGLRLTASQLGQLQAEKDRGL